MPFIHTYLVDEDGNYIHDGSNNRIIVESFEYLVTSFDWRRIASSVKKPAYIRSFQIRRFDSGATWLLIVNQKQLVGIYPSQDAALQVLTGLFTRIGARDDAAEAAMTQQLSRGISTIDSADNNIALARSGRDLVITLSSIDLSGIAIPVITLTDYMTPGEPVPGTIIAPVTETSGSEVFTAIEGYFSAPENSYIQAYLTDFGVRDIIGSNVLLKDDVAPSGFSVLIGTLTDESAAPEATVVDGAYVGSAYAYPQWVTDDWPEGVSPSYSYAWTYSTDAQAPVAVGGSGSTLDLSLVPYGAILTCGVVATAFVNGKIATSTDPATQVAVAVISTNVVTDIKLFTTSDPTGTPVETPVAGTTYYAYGFSAGDVYVSAADMTWTTDIVVDTLTISPLGWDASLMIPGSTPTDADPGYDYNNTTAISIDRAGFSATGAAVTQVLTTSLTDTVQQVFPNEASKDVVNTAGDVISRQSLGITTFADDVVTAVLTDFDSVGTTRTLGVTNNSEAPMPKVIANWTSTIVDYEHTDTMTLDLMAIHQSAEGGDMGIACVKFIVTDSLANVTTVTVSSTTTVVADKTGISYPVFRLVHDLSGDADGESYTIKAEVYPNWGAMWSTETASAGIHEWKRVTNPNQVFDALRWRDTGGGAIPTMYVSDTGDNANPGTSGSPKRDIGAAVLQLNSITGDHQGIVNISGTHLFWDMSSGNPWTSSVTYPLKFRGDGTAVSRGGATSSSARQAQGNPFYIHENINFDWSDTTVGTGTTAQGGTNFQWNSSNAEVHNSLRTFVNCDITGSSAAPASSYCFVYTTVSFYHCRDLGGNDFFFAEQADLLTGIARRGAARIGCLYTAVQRTSGIGGSTIVANLGHGNIKLFVGDNRDVTVNGAQKNWTSLPWERPTSNGIAAYNSIVQDGGSTGISAVLLTVSQDSEFTAPQTDMAIFGNYFEMQAGTTEQSTQPITQIGADSNNKAMDNVIIWNNTTYGQRVNYNYNDKIYGLRQTFSVRNNSMWALYIKSDNFASGIEPQEDRYGNWSSMYGADSGKNFSYMISDSFRTYHENDSTRDSLNSQGVMLGLTTGTSIFTGARSLGDPPCYVDPAYAATTGWTADNLLPILGTGADGLMLGAGQLPTVAPV